MKEEGGGREGMRKERGGKGEKKGEREDERRSEEEGE